MRTGRLISVSFLIVGLLPMIAATNTASGTSRESGSENEIHFTREHATSTAADAGFLAGTSAVAGPPAERNLTRLWTVHTEAPMLSSPKLADVDGDGLLDVLLTTYGQDPDTYGSGWIHLLDGAGNPLPGWPFYSSYGPFSASACIGDIDGEPGVEVLAGDWYRLHLLDAGGNELPGWPLAIGVNYTPALHDLDGDGDLEMIVPQGNSLHALQANGVNLPGWPVHAPEMIGAPAVGDLDGDGEAEIMAGTLAGPVGPDPYEVYVWELDGTVKAGFPKATSGVCKAAPAVGDIDQDGIFEIVIPSYDTSNDDFLNVWDANGNLEPGWPQQAGRCRLSHPALADVDGDGDLEIFIGGGRASPPFASVLYAYEANGDELPGFPVEIPVGAQINSGPIVMDLDGDPSLLEIVVKVENYIYAYHSDGSLVADFPYFLSDQNHSGTNSPTPAMADVDADGDPELVFCANYDQVDFIDLAEPYAFSLDYWPSMKRDAYNSAFFFSGVVSAVGDDEERPFELPPLVTALSGAHPNPFNPLTTIRFSLAREQQVKVSVFDLSGRRVAELVNGVMPAGDHPVLWNGKDSTGRNVSSGSYMIYMEAEDAVESSKITLVR